MSSTMSEISVIGVTVFDIFVHGFTSFPNKGKGQFFKSLNTSIGGCGAVTALALKNLDIRVNLFSCVGNDFFGKKLIKTLKESSLPIKNINITSTLPTPTSILFIDNQGERSYLHLPGASSEIRINDKNLSQIIASKILHIGGALIIPGLDGKPMSNLLQAVKENCVVTSVDLAWDSSDKWMKKLSFSLPFIDILMLNRDELKALTKIKSINSAIRLLHELGVKIVLVKMGADGVFISKDLLNFFVPALKVKAIDTTGAGDNFSAGFLYGILKGWSIIDSAKFGNLLGALAVKNFGGTSGFLSREKTLELFLKYYDTNNYS